MIRPVSPFIIDPLLFLRKQFQTTTRISSTELLVWKRERDASCTLSGYR